MCSFISAVKIPSRLVRVLLFTFRKCEDYSEQSKPYSEKDGNRKLHPVTCKLYDVRRRRPIRLSGWQQKSVMEMCQYLSNEANRPPFTYLSSDQECSKTVNTVFGNVPLGSTVAYQLINSKPNKTSFNFYCLDNSLLPPD